MAPYAVPADMPRLGLPATAIAGIPPATQIAALEAASRKADGYLGAHFKLPLLSWTDDLRQAVCELAAWSLLSTRGFNPESGADASIRKRYEDAISWLKDVSKGTVTPLLVDSTPSGSPEPSAPEVHSQTRRGW